MTGRTRWKNPCSCSDWQRQTVSSGWSVRPTCIPVGYDNDITTIAPAFDELVSHVRDVGIGVQLAMGAEVRFSDELMIQLRNERIPMIGEWDGYDCLFAGDAAPEYPHGH